MKPKFFNKNQHPSSSSSNALKLQKTLDGDQRRLESIVRKQQEERERKRLISQALEGRGVGKRIKFTDSDDEEEENEEKEINAPSTGHKPEKPSTSSINNNDEEGGGGDDYDYDPRFQMGEHFFDSTDDQMNGLSNGFSKNDNKMTNSQKSPRPPFRRYDPKNPDHVRWVRSLKNQQNDNDDEGNKNDQSSATTTNGIRKIEQNDVDGLEKQPSTPSKSIVDPSFAEELRQRLTMNKPKQAFNFLASFGRDSGPMKEQKGAERAKDNEDVSEQRGREGEEEGQEDKQAKSCINTASLCLYKPPADPADQQQNGDFRSEPKNANRCFFFVDENSWEIRTAMATFRRHQTEDQLRRNWPKQRELIVKFYKNARKSALRHKRDMQKREAEATGGGGKQQKEEKPKDKEDEEEKTEEKRELERKRKEQKANKKKKIKRNVNNFFLNF